MRGRTNIVSSGGDTTVNTRYMVKKYLTHFYFSGTSGTYSLPTEVAAGIKRFIELGYRQDKNKTVTAANMLEYVDVGMAHYSTTSSAVGGSTISSPPYSISVSGTITISRPSSYLSDCRVEIVAYFLDEVISTTTLIQNPDTHYIATEKTTAAVTSNDYIYVYPSNTASLSLMLSQKFTYNLTEVRHGLTGASVWSSGNVTSRAYYMLNDSSVATDTSVFMQGPRQSMGLSSRTPKVFCIGLYVR